ncbi:hypothetical protein VPH35_077752 [Triticum aestivum]|uniref:uncharacterized protein n=1 Tax=Triticum aestivum TaxID=4565 RepID=UPI001D02C2C8|nr:uncharacterized protein LOC123096990 [Triticum aestivum]
MNKPAEDPKTTEPEKQTISEASHQTIEPAANYPPPKTLNVKVDPMGVDPSSAKPPSPTKPVEEEAEEVVVIGTGYAEPMNPTVLAKHSAKEEFLATDKGKWKLDLESYASFNASEIHVGYLSRLHTSRDMEAGLVNLMKERFEAELSMKESHVVDLRKNIKLQQSETSKAKSKLKAALEVSEKLKTYFNT